MFQSSNKTQDQRASGSVHLQGNLNQMSEVLDRSVCVGSNIVDWWFKNPGGEKMPTRTFVLITLLSSILSNADAISILLRSRSAETAKPLLRSMLECLFYLQWVMQDESGDLARAYLVMARKKELDLINRADPNHHEYKSIAGKLKPEDNFFTLDDVDPRMNEHVKSMLEKKLASPAAVDVFENLKSHKSPKAKNVWYALNDGPTSVYELAVELGLAGFYERLYKPLCSNTHASDSDSFVLPFEGDFILKPLRRVENAPWIFDTTCSIVNICNGLMSHATADEPLVAYVQNEYVEHIKPLKNDLANQVYEYGVKSSAEVPAANEPDAGPCPP